MKRLKMNKKILVLMELVVFIGLGVFSNVNATEISNTVSYRGVSVTIKSSTDFVVAGQITKPVITWAGSNTVLGGCTVSSNLPTPPMVTVPGGKCDRKLRCSNGATPAIACSWIFFPLPTFKCSCSCPSKDYRATSDSTEVPVPTEDTTYSVTCRQSDGKGKFNSATACISINIARNDCASRTCSNKTCFDGIAWVPGTLDYQDYDNYICRHSIEGMNDFCLSDLNCGKTPTGVDTVSCRATRTCDGTIDDTSKTVADCKANGAIDCEPYLPTPCPGCQLKIRNNGWREIAP